MFAINFSGQSLHDDGLPEHSRGSSRAAGCAPALFCFELTENATVGNLTRAEVLMRRLRKLGCGVALDDFGTGLSSLSCLRQLPISMLKIDGSFVRDVLKDPRAESMVRAIAQLARSHVAHHGRRVHRDRGDPRAHRRASAWITARDSRSAGPCRSPICSPSCR